MSVQYYLNKDIRIGDLKEAGFKVERDNDGTSPYSFIIESEKYKSWVGAIKLKGHDDNEDNLIVEELEGRFSHGGGCCMLEMCDKLDCKFITDEDIDNALYTGDEITEETFDSATEEFRKQLSTPPASLLQ